MPRGAFLERLGAKSIPLWIFALGAQNGGTWGAFYCNQGAKDEEKCAWGAKWQQREAQITARVPINTPSALGAVTHTSIHIWCAILLLQPPFSLILHLH